MANTVHTNITFNLDDEAERAVYEAVQQQNHKQRSRFILSLAFAGLSNESDSCDNNLADVMAQLSEIKKMLTSGTISAVPAQAPVISEPEPEETEIDDDTLADMLDMMMF